MPAQSPLLHAADCLEWAPGEQKIKSRPEKDSFLKKKEGKSAKPCGQSLCPAAAESWTFGKRQEELNCFTPELLTGRQSTTHTHLPSMLVISAQGMKKILASDSRNIYQEKISLLKLCLCFLTPEAQLCSTTQLSAIPEHKHWPCAGEAEWLRKPPQERLGNEMLKCTRFLANPHHMCLHKSLQKTPV